MEYDLSFEIRTRDSKMKRTSGGLMSHEIVFGNDVYLDVRGPQLN